MRVRDVRQEGRAALAAARSDLSADVRALEVDVLVAHCLGIASDRLPAELERVLSEPQRRCCELLFKRRGQGEPVAYLTGRREFYGRDFMVTPAVLIPRPETELLVERCVLLLNRLPDGAQLIDVGTGSGCIVITAALECERSQERGLRFVGSDISPEALRTARGNAAALGADESILLAEADLLADELLPPQPGREVVVSNLPYIPDSESLPRDVAAFEPIGALRGGPDGFGHIRRLLDQWRRRPGSILLLEIGEGQDHALECLLSERKLRDFRFFKDLRGINRVVEVRTSCA